MLRILFCSFLAIGISAATADEEPRVCVTDRDGTRFCIASSQPATLEAKIDPDRFPICLDTETGTRFCVRSKGQVQLLPH